MKAIPARLRDDKVLPSDVWPWKTRAGTRALQELSVNQPQLRMFRQPWFINVRMVLGCIPEKEVEQVFSVVCGILKGKDERLGLWLFSFLAVLHVVFDKLSKCLLNNDGAGETLYLRMLGMQAGESDGVAERPSSSDLQDRFASYYYRLWRPLKYQPHAQLPQQPPKGANVFGRLHRQLPAAVQYFTAYVQPVL